MIRPRNTLVLCALITKATRVVGSIVQTTSNDEFQDAIVLAVGPGSIAAEGGRSDTFDLMPGQTVTVMNKRPDRNGVLKDIGIPVVLNAEGGVGKLYEQGCIMAIVSDPPMQAMPHDSGRAGRVNSTQIN